MLEQDLTQSLLSALGLRIKEIRIAKNISQSSLARESDMEKATISKIEHGKVNISFLTLYRLSQCLKVSIGEITDNAGSLSHL